MSPEVIEEFRRLWAEGASIKKIKSATGYSAATLMDYAKHHRDEFPYRYAKVPSDTRERFTRLILDGDITRARAAEMLGVSKETVRRWLRNCGRGH